jgi:hypothetical protein
MHHISPTPARRLAGAAAISRATRRASPPSGVHRWRKAAFAVRQNVLAFVAAADLRRVALLTLTFPGVRSYREAHRRLNSFKTGVLRRLVPGTFLRVSARGVGGVIHLHLLVECRQDVRTGYHHDAVSGRDCSNAALASLRRELRRHLRAYGFGGFYELSPLKRAPAALAAYLAKQLDPAHHPVPPEDRRIRRVAYARPARRAAAGAMPVQLPVARTFIRPCSHRFSWRMGWWRPAVAAFAAWLGCADTAGLAARLGRRWAYQVWRVALGASFLLDQEHEVLAVPPEVIAAAERLVLRRARR